MPWGRRSSFPSRALAWSQMRSPLDSIQQFVDAEVSFQLQVGPVVEGIAQGLRHGARPGQEFLFGGHGAGAILFADAVGPHGAPLVVVALQPDLEKVLKTAVFGHFAGRQMAMVVQNRLPLGVFVVQPLRGSVG